MIRSGRANGNTGLIKGTDETYIMLKNITVSAIVAVVVVAISSLFGGQSNLGGLVNTQASHFTEGFYAGHNDQFAISNAGAITSSGTVNFTGEVKAKVITDGAVTAIASASTHLTASQICNSTLITQDLSGSGASTSVTTFPTASALAADCLPDAGDSYELVYRNISNDAGEQETLTTNTGLTLKYASGSAATINVNEGAVLKFINRTGSAFDVIITEFGN